MLDLAAGARVSDSPASAGVSYTSSPLAVVGSLTWGITDRLRLGILAPGVAYRFGQPGQLERVPAPSASTGAR